MSYRLDLSEDALSKMEDLSRADAKILKQILIKCLSLRRTLKPQDCKELQNFNYQGLKGFRIDQGEYRIVYTVDEDIKAV